MQISAGLFACRCPADDLGDHRVEVRRDLATGLDPGVDAHAVGGGKFTAVSKPGLGWKSRPGSSAYKRA
jgi:hypothetical protein